MRVLFNTWQQALRLNIATASPVLLQSPDTHSWRKQCSALFIVFWMFPVSILSQRLINVAWRQMTMLLGPITLNRLGRKFNKVRAFLWPQGASVKKVIVSVTSANLHLFSFYCDVADACIKGNRTRCYQLCSTSSNIPINLFVPLVWGCFYFFHLVACNLALGYDCKAENGLGVNVKSIRSKY